MTESSLEGAIFYMIRAYLDSELATPKEVSSILERLQGKVMLYNSQHLSLRSGGSAE